MAVLKLFQPADMSGSNLTFYGDVTKADGSEIIISNGYRATIYTGSFDYSGGYLEGGTIRGIDAYEGGRHTVSFVHSGLDAVRWSTLLDANAGWQGFALAGADRIAGSFGSDVLIGYRGDDRIEGRGGADRLVGGNGADVLRGGVGADRLEGQRGADRLLGQMGDDVARGGNGADRIFGGAGADDLQGNFGRDLLKGGHGRDLLDGGRGNDRLTGGKDRDIFVFRLGDGKDVLTDFDARIDVIDLRGFGAGQLDVEREGADLILNARGLEIRIENANDLAIWDIEFV